MMRTPADVAGAPPDGRRQRGQALAEFALVAPLLFIVILAIIEGGRFVFYSELLNNATREGARYAIVHGANSSCPSGPAPPGETNFCDVPGDNVKAAVREAAISLVGVGDLFVSPPTWTNHNGRGEHVTVRVDYTYDPLVKTVIGVDLIPSIPISAESTLVIHN